METKISVIIPAYNVADLLPACLDSVLSQSMGELEIILVDDGSTDATPAVCDRYAAMDPRVHVFHTANAGVSEARNTGIAHASGAYFWFVDADDTLEPRACAEVYDAAKAQDADAVIFDYRRVQGGRDAGVFPSIFPEGVYAGDSIVADLLTRFLGFSNAGVHRWLRREPEGLYVENPALWRVLLRAEIVRDHGLRFDPTLRVGEDTIFISLCLSYAARVVVTHSILYCQLLHGSSAIARYEKDPEGKLQNKLALLAARHALAADIRMRRGTDVSPCWQGSTIMSYMELCLLFANPSRGKGIRMRYARFLSYARNPLVAQSLAAFPLPRRAGVRSVPFWLMKRRLHGVLFLCASLLSLVRYQVRRG